MDYEKDNREMPDKNRERENIPQSTLGNSYERMASLKASNGLVCSMINAGLIKPENIEDAFMVEETYYNRYLARITEGLDTESATKQGFTQKTQKPSYDSVRPLTEGQRKALFVITHNKDGKQWVENDKHEHLTKDIELYSFDEASLFIEKYGK